VRERRDYIIEKLGRAEIERIDVEDGTIAEMMKRLGLTYLVPYRPEMSPNASADIIVSRAVFEHIPANTLETMLSNFRRILVPGGAMVHFIDCSDHYWQCDHSISRCNFLKYEDWQWRLLSLNPQSYHNRLRHSDFAAMFKRHGFKIIFEYRLTRGGEQREVAVMKLASRFTGRDVEDLAALSSQFVVVAP
jgi:SAM-dependent methyltransferase